MYKEDRQEERNAARGVGNHVGADLGETVRLVLARHVDEGVVQGHLQGVWRPTESVKWVLNLGCARRGGQDAGRRLQQGQGLLVFIVLRCPVAGDGEFSNEPARHFWSLAGLGLSRLAAGKCCFQ